MRQEFGRCILPGAAQAFFKNVSIVVGKTEVNEFQIIVGLCYEDILRLEVIVNYALTVNGPTASSNWPKIIFLASKDGFSFRYSDRLRPGYTPLQWQGRRECFLPMRRPRR